VSLLQTHVQLQGNVQSGLAENRTSALPKDETLSDMAENDSAKEAEEKLKEAVNAARKEGKKQLEKAKDRFGRVWKDSVDTAKKWTNKFDEFKDTVDGFKDKLGNSQLLAVKTSEAVPTVGENELVQLLHKDFHLSDSAAAHASMVSQGMVSMLHRLTMVSKGIWGDDWDSDDPFWEIVPDWEEKYLRVKPSFEWTTTGIDGVIKHGHFEEYGKPAVGQTVPTNFGDALDEKLLKEGWTTKVPAPSSKRTHGKKHHKHLPPLVAVTTAILTMLTIGGDDVIWLLPFFIGKNKWSHTFWYIVFMELVVVISYFIKSGMNILEKANPGMPVSKILQAIASVMLTAFAGYLFMDWWNEEDEDDEEEKDPDTVGEVSVNEGNVRHSPDLGAGRSLRQSPDFGAGGLLESAQPKSDDRGCLPSSDPKGEGGCCHVVNHGDQHHDKLGLGMLFAISMVGSMDNFAVYSFLLYEGVMNAYELSVGVVVASSIIAAVSHGALAFKPLLRVVERLPLWIIFLCLSIWSYYELAFD